MWQIMWMFSLLPDALINWIINLIIIVGVAGIFSAWIGRWIPVVNNYTRWAKPVGVVLVCLGLYFKGGVDNELAWRAKVAELEAKIKVSEEKSKEANQKLADKLKEKTKIIKEVQVVIKERIKEVEKKIDAQCVVAPEAISILNDAARNVKGDNK